ncbi:leucine-rich repeat domain-containing protein [uncultured Flavobacterium sp.]|uniref:leucine-rich repeat domain-containing protein n=1 Tax=uncultured Flavobacterium sp. TaxID=165435 RepID=UPI0029307051|nr:leucine-rich repeat domain-containing protein [uncultured Flavobacterium sp.]
MKHHFGDFLDRTSDYWTTIPNRERFAFIADFEIANKDEVKILTISKTQDKVHWEQIFYCPNLEELTLHEPTKEQVQAIRKLTNIRRLRMTFFRATDIEFIGDLCNLEELILEYISGFSDLTPLKKLKKLKSVHFENLRRVTDFSGLAGIESLKYIYINGTLDWNQPVESFDFLNEIPNLEILNMGFGVKVVDQTYPIFKSLVKNKKIKKLRVGRAFCSLEDYAFIEVLFGSENIVYSDDTPVELFYEYKERIEFLGKGMRSISSQNSNEKCEKITQEYEKMKIKARDYLLSYCN